MFAASLGSHLCKEDNLTDKIPGLQDIFGGIYSAIVESQNTIEQHYLDEIKKDYFDESGSPKMFGFNCQQMMASFTTWIYRQ